MVTLGAKYQRIVENKRSYILRVNRITKDDDGNEICYLIDEEHNNLTVKKTAEELKNDYILIVPDCMMNIMFTKDDRNPENPIFDIFVCVNKSADVNNGNNEPCIVARQNMYSVSKNFMSTKGNKYYVGDCFNRKTLPSGNQKLSDLFEFTSIEESWQVCMYIDDSLDVLKYLGEDINTINSYFSKIKTLYHNEFTYGYDTSLKEFLINNNFMDHFRYAFNILPLDFPIDIKDNRDADGNIIFNKKQQTKFEDAIMKHITNVTILPYDKDIDVSKIVSYTHMIVSDSMNKIYLIAYVVIDNYAIDADLLSHIANIK
jgi:hypothetical protein